MSKKEFLEKFNHAYAPQLLGWQGRDGRAETFRAVFEVLGDSPLIVETGTMRTPGNWSGDGNSTVLFDEYCKMVGGKLYSVDISPESTEAAKPWVSDRTTLITENSLRFLERLEETIDLLYLDSLDGNFVGAAEHQIEEFRTAMPRLRAGSIVFVDDISTKSLLLAPYMDHVLAAKRICANKTQIAWWMP